MPMQPLAGTLPLAQFSNPSSTTCIRSARSRNRAAAWSYDLAQWRQYQLSRSPANEEEIDAEYERLASAGPDFTAYHVGSSFAEPPLHTITREDRVKALQAFDAIRAGLYRHCRAPRAQAVSQNYRHVFGVLLSYAVKRGRVFPSLETIAGAAMCSRSTVLRAIAWLKLFGLVDRIRRLARVRTPLGNIQSRQTSNAYRVNVALSGLSSLALAVFRAAPSVTTRLHQPTQRLSNEEKAPRVTQFESRSLQEAR
jgi:hypothetical protein